MNPFLASLLLLTASASAQVPESGRWQELAFSASEVDASMEERYIDRTVDLAAAGKLDEDHRLLVRLRYVSAELIRAAIALKPEAAQWQWEVHTTSDPDIDALCMAGGKILVGSAFVHQLALTDGELATMLAHEVAHVVAEHPRETLSEAMLLNRLPVVPLEVVMARLDSDLSLQIRLSKLSSLQESEADHLGMMLAHRAGWAAADMVSFYRKLAASEQSALVSNAYPATASRVSMARGMARLFDE
ncbi:Peptidase family M48 [Duganella sp. CF402]|uniref:M48 family metalloprotease n=1 Tax=unclassified Duganella TaxID=2636909 RepID=UPI0008D56CEB|nr:MULTISPECIES: M48 family metalloprotease [unclassified Duganella]RZT03954.1 peptidase M48-like protein [Duganella sp. BK701]SEM53665.1 Peptidase family M48 [Duganella sp. CF402]